MEFLLLLIKHTITYCNDNVVTHLKACASFVSWWASYGAVTSFSAGLVVCCKVEVVVLPSCEAAFPLVVAEILEVGVEEVAG